MNASGHHCAEHPSGRCSCTTHPVLVDTGNGMRIPMPRSNFDPFPPDAKPEKPVVETHAPIYANLYPAMVQVAREHGYALAVHGSMKRDLDVIAVPWIENPSSPAKLVEALSRSSYFVSVVGPEIRLHNRWVWTLAWPGTCFVDLSVMCPK